MKRIAGFSLIEVIISGAIVATTVGALFAVASMSVRLTTLSQERLIASQLAREGLEIARQIRDNNFISDVCDPNGTTLVVCKDWYDGLTTATEVLPAIKATSETTETGFRFDTAPASSAKCSDYFLRDTTTANGGITQSAATAGGLNQQLFCRRISVEVVDGFTKNDALRIRSQVAWTGNGKRSLRDLAAFNANPECSNAVEEWCSEQTILLTNWRTSL